MPTDVVGGNGRDSIDTLRAARAALREAVNDGADHVTELRDLVEDQLIEAIAARRRGGTRR
jgi:hypothetical protein